MENTEEKSLTDELVKLFFELSEMATNEKEPEQKIHIVTCMLTIYKILLCK